MKRPDLRRYSLAPLVSLLVARCRVSARVRFAVRVSEAAHVYMLQKTQRDGVTALYPRAELALENPLRADRAYEIPPDPEQWFSVNQEDVGTENVYVIASRTRIERFESALQQLSGDSAPVKAIARRIGADRCAIVK